MYLKKGGTRRVRVGVDTHGWNKRDELSLSTCPVVLEELRIVEICPQCLESTRTSRQVRDSRTIHTLVKAAKGTENHEAHVISLKSISM